MNLRRKIPLVCRRFLFFMSGVLGNIMLDADCCSVAYLVVLFRAIIKHRNEMEGIIVELPLPKFQLYFYGIFIIINKAQWCNCKCIKNRGFILRLLSCIWRSEIPCNFAWWYDRGIYIYQTLRFFDFFHQSHVHDTPKNFFWFQVFLDMIILLMDHGKCLQFRLNKTKIRKLSGISWHMQLPSL